MGLLTRIDELTLQFRLDVVRYARRHGLRAAVNHFQVSGWRIQRWVRRFARYGPLSLRFDLRPGCVRAVKRSALQCVRPMRVRMGPFPPWGPVGQAEPYEDTQGCGSFFDLRRAEGSAPTGDMSRDSARLSFDFVAPLIQREIAALGEDGADDSQMDKSLETLDSKRSDGVQELISWLRGIAADPEDSGVQREAALGGIALIEQLQMEISLLSEIAEKSGLHSTCTTISDQQLAKFVADALGKEREGDAFQLVHKVLSRHFQAHGWPPGESFWDAVRFGYRLLLVALTNELECRVTQVESEWGSAVNEVIVEEKQRGKLLRDLGNRVAEWPSFVHEVPQPDEDDPSWTALGIWEQISPLTSTSPPAANPDFLLARIRGNLNLVQQRARDFVWLERRRESEYSDPLVEIAMNDSEEGVPLDAFPSKYEPEQEGVNRKLVAEHGIRQAGLSEQDLELIDLVKAKGRTQKEVAQQLGISQGEVSKRLNAALEKLRQVLDQAT